MKQGATYLKDIEQRKNENKLFTIFGILLLSGLTIVHLIG